MEHGSLENLAITSFREMEGRAGAKKESNARRSTKHYDFLSGGKVTVKTEHIFLKSMTS